MEDDSFVDGESCVEDEVGEDPQECGICVICEQSGGRNWRQAMCHELHRRVRFLAVKKNDIK